MFKTLGVVGLLGFGMIASTFAADVKTLFGMSCEVTRITVSGYPQKAIFEPSKYAQELESLKSKGYSRIDLIREFSHGDQMIKVLLGEKCEKPILRINGEESVNDIGVDHIEKKGSKLLLYGAKDGYATMITCDLGSLTGNSYIPFDQPQTKKPGYSQNTGNSQTSSVLTLNVQKIHPQAKLALMRKPVSEIVKVFGGEWNRDRAKLASAANIKSYHGTKAQNLKIRSYLLSLLEISVESTTTEEIKLPSDKFQASQKMVVSELVTLRNYQRKYDRRSLFQEIGENISKYRASRAHNLKIRSFLLDKISLLK